MMFAIFGTKIIVCIRARYLLQTFPYQGVNWSVFSDFTPAVLLKEIERFLDFIKP